MLIIYYLELFVLWTFSTCICSDIQQQEQSSSQLYHILGALQPFRAQICQFKFENCIQDLSYADQLDNDCNIYSRLRDCYRSLLDEKQCLTAQLKRQFKKAKQNEYESCGIAMSFESIHSSTDVSSSSSSSAATRILTVDYSYRHILCLFLIFSLFLVVIWCRETIDFRRWHARQCPVILMMISLFDSGRHFSLFLSLISSLLNQCVRHFYSSHCCIHWKLCIEIINTFNSFKWYLSSALWSR
jgi:uncharacterized membrane protein YhaH (DUF805 family)